MPRQQKTFKPVHIVTAYAVRPRDRLGWGLPTPGLTFAPASSCPMPREPYPSPPPSGAHPRCDALAVAYVTSMLAHVGLRAVSSCCDTPCTPLGDWLDGQYRLQKPGCSDQLASLSPGIRWP